jgi:hypothetical protein
MYPAYQFPGGDRVSGPENLQIRLSQRALYEIKDELIIIDSNKLNGRRNTCELARFSPKNQQLHDIPDNQEVFGFTNGLQSAARLQVN